ncbi:gluconokinase [Streptomyces sp. NPDC004647]|uniref:gluconokinase n=1 Tax=Streptomyces sp. NPDC004647 TaxID=3154671 RepID=UPI00339EEF23
MTTARRAAPEAAPLIVVMGVSGCGKTSVGELLAARLGVPYADADGFHPPESVAKMSAGTPLDDTDRAPWLDSIGAWLAAHAAGGGVVSCSALKRRYRDRLAGFAPGAFFVHLDGSYELIARRIARRTGHFMPESLLRSQFDDLEPLEAGENGTTVPVDGSPEETTDRALAELPVRPR